MHEHLSQLFQTLNQGREAVYTSLVETRGSTPQKPGARMLVFADGSQLGTLGGGCVEAEVKRQALELLLTGGEPALLTFQLDQDYGWDDGLICGGRMTMLVDPVRPTGDRRFYKQLQQCLNVGCTEVTLLKPCAEVPAGTRFLFNHQGAPISSVPTDIPVPDEVLRNLRPLTLRPRPYTVADASYIPHLPRVPLYIVGGGHVGQKVAEYAHEVDFDVTVIDDREQYCNRERFPTAQALIVGTLAETLESLVVAPSAFSIVVTRGHQHDEEALHYLIQKPHAYLGMIGSRRKIKLIVDDLIQRGVSREKLAKVHAPIGLEIGSQTVPEIAISIVAELIACRNLAGEEGQVSRNSP